MTTPAILRRPAAWLSAPENAANALRLLMTLVCAALVVVDHVSAGRLVWLIALVSAGTFAGAAWRPDTLTGNLLRAAEAVAGAAAVLATGAAASPLLPYLVAPAAAGGLASGIAGAVVPAGWAALALLAGHPLAHVGGSVRLFGATTAEWVLLALAVGLMGAWVRRLSTDRRAPADGSYADAYRLLSELRTVARRLPGTLDPVDTAQSFLAAVKERCPYERAAVFTRTESGRLVPITVDGTDNLEWELELADGTPFAEAWQHQRAVVRPQVHTTNGVRQQPGTGVVVPLRMGARNFGLLGFESSRTNAYGAEQLRAVQSLADSTALQLETATLFDEVRYLATAEERQRLARGIHDGIAQELVYLGYVLDALTADSATGRDRLVAQLKELRGEVSRIVSDVRHSIFDLRTEVDGSGGLGAALSRYVRSVGTNSHLTVNLSLSESTQRLSRDTESEILRIAQEAVTKARRQQGVANLWVTLEVDPPCARLLVEDDGGGSRSHGKDDDVSIDLMRERAERVRGTLLVEAREPVGTRVEFTLRPEPAAPRW